MNRWPPTAPADVSLFATGSEVAIAVDARASCWPATASRRAWSPCPAGACSTQQREAISRRRARPRHGQGRHRGGGAPRLGALYRRRRRLHRHARLRRQRARQGSLQAFRHHAEAASAKRPIETRAANRPARVSSGEGSEAMAVRVAINGFGRIGRLVLRAIVEAGRTRHRGRRRQRSGPGRDQRASAALRQRARPLSRRGDGRRRHDQRRPAQIKVTADQGPAEAAAQGTRRRHRAGMHRHLHLQGQGRGASRRPAPSACWSPRPPTAPTSPWSMASITTS